MTNKQYLQQLYRLKHLIESDKRELAHLRYLSTSISGCDYKEHFSDGNVHSRVEETVVDIIDLERKIQKEIAEYMRLDEEIRETIGKQENDTEKLLLRLRYIEHLTWEKIAVAMNYSIMQVYRVHKNALKNLKKTW